MPGKGKRVTVMAMSRLNPTWTLPVVIRDSPHMQPSITLLGTGGPRPDAPRGATSLLIETADAAILIDAGCGVVRQLAALGIPRARVNPLLITHHHHDHIGELHDVILSSWLMGRTQPGKCHAGAVSTCTDTTGVSPFWQPYR
jgi:ribonuclease BN (tRNA processing enzyme)